MPDPIGTHELQHLDRVLHEFVSVITTLSGTSESFRTSVGRGICIASSLFVQRFGSARTFQQSPEASKAQYIQSFADAEARFSKRWPTMAIGFALFRLWLEALFKGDQTLARNLWTGLAALAGREGGSVCDSRATADLPSPSQRPADCLAAA
jgi:hypothetical protein